MILSENEVRKSLVEEAISWLNTPFHDKAMIKGAGVDCAYLPYAIYKACGLLPSDFTMPDYSPQFFVHRNEEIFVEAFLRTGLVEVAPQPLKPGDLVVAKYGRVYAHSGIVIEWPKVIHANPNSHVVKYDSVEMYRLFSGDAPKKYFTLWPELLKPLTILPK